MGTVVLKARHNTDIRIGQVFVPIHWTQQFANASVVSNVIPQIVDPLSGQPESKHATVKLAAVTNATYNLVFSDKPLTFSTATYWCRIPSVNGYRYEVVWPQNANVAFLKDVAGDQPGEWLEYVNPTTGQTRLALISAQKLIYAVYSRLAPESVFSQWLI